jgi:F-type H+-transporting ATPase subunit delta
MASGKKQIQQLARQLFKLSAVNGELSADRVAGVLQYLEKHRPAHSLAVLKIYQRLIVAEVARGQALIDHAGSINEALLAGIVAAMAARYRRKLTSLSRRDDSLLAGLRVRVGDDVYESTVASQLAQLATAV